MKPTEPWLEPANHIPQLLGKWNALEKEIKELFDARKNKAALLPMKQGIDLLLQFVFRSNGLEVRKLEELNADSLLIKPVNFIERIQFLIKRPNLYPSYVQLCELFSEQEKQYSKYIATEAAKRK